MSNYLVLQTVKTLEAVPDYDQFLRQFNSSHIKTVSRNFQQIQTGLKDGQHNFHFGNLTVGAADYDKLEVADAGSAIGTISTFGQFATYLTFNRYYDGAWQQNESTYHGWILTLNGAAASPTVTLRISQPDAPTVLTEVLVIDEAGALLIGNGTVSLPAFSFNADTDTGIYRIGANNLGVAINGTKVVGLATTAITLNLPTADGSDNGKLTIAGGGGLLDSRGAMIQCHGNEHGSDPGDLTLWAGNIAGGAIEFITQNAVVGQFTYAGNLEVVNYAKLGGAESLKTYTYSYVLQAADITATYYDWSVTSVTLTKVRNIGWCCYDTSQATYKLRKRANGDYVDYVYSQSATVFRMGLGASAAAGDTISLMITEAQ